MESTFWMTAQETEDELRRRESLHAQIVAAGNRYPSPHGSLTLADNHGQSPDVVPVVNQRNI